MNKTDVIVIGGGLSGLISAAVSVQQNKKVILITYGFGSLPLFSGAVDFFSRSKSPKSDIEKLSANHPYTNITVDKINESIKFFTDLTNRYNLNYSGSLNNLIPVVTSVGTLKYSCLVPESMNASNISSKKKIYVVGIHGLKDFYSDMIADNLKKFVTGKDIESVEIELGLLGGRDITSLDAAELLDDESAAKNFVSQLKKFDVNNSTLFIVPPILGTEGNNTYKNIKSQLGTEIIETTCLPPSTPGLRLQKALVKSLRESGVKIFENTKVIRGVSEGNKIIGVTVQSAAREKTYKANKFILATGGFYSGGLYMRKFEEPKEIIFDLPVYFKSGEDNWSNKNLFEDKPQGFSATGILTDNFMKPVDLNGKNIFDNLYVVGNMLGGSDFVYERSLGGISISSAYKAAIV